MRILMLVLFAIPAACSSGSPVAAGPEPPLQRQAEAGPDAPYHRQFDFRFSNWGDAEATVAANEPGGLELSHVGGGKATKDSFGIATAVLKFTGGISDTVTVYYEFRGGVLVAGSYFFDHSVPASRMDTIRAELARRYGAFTLVNGYATWTPGVTVITVFPHDTESGISISYRDTRVPAGRAAEDDYNDLPPRVVVGE